MFRPDMSSRRVYLIAMKGLILAAPSLPAGVLQGYCPNPSGQDILTTLSDIAQAPCGDCKWLSMMEARRLIDSGTVQKVELCMTVSSLQEEHAFLRVTDLGGNVLFRDPALEHGAPARAIGDFIAETVWQVPRSSRS